MHRSPVLPLLLVLALTAAGCGFGDSAGERLMEEVAGQAADEDVDLDMDEDGMSIETEDGEVRFDEEGFSATGEDGDVEMGGGELPDAFPEEMPLPDGEVQMSMAGTDDDGEQIQVTLVAEDDLATLEAFLADELPDAGWDVEEEAEMTVEGMSQRHVAVEGHGWEGHVMVQQGDDEPPIVNVTLVSS